MRESAPRLLDCARACQPSPFRPSTINRCGHAARSSWEWPRVPLARLGCARFATALNAAVEVPGYRQAASAIADRLRQEDRAAGVLNALSQGCAA